MPKRNGRTLLEDLSTEAANCRRCGLAPGRSNVVFGVGTQESAVMFIGEAPGAAEDLAGKPFVGRSGKLLDELLAEIGIDRRGTYITNVVKCRPPGNRDPLAREITSCSRWLEREIALIRPDFICTLGNFATKLLRGDPTGITKVHGRAERRLVAGREVVLFPLFHPAAALRSGDTLALLRSDLAELANLLRDVAD